LRMQIYANSIKMWNWIWILFHLIFFITANLNQMKKYKIKRLIYRRFKFVKNILFSTKQASHNNLALFSDTKAKKKSSNQSPKKRNWIYCIVYGYYKKHHLRLR
jgi:hypothetical protein